MDVSVPAPPSWLSRPATGAVLAPLALVATTAALAPLLGEREVLDVALVYLLVTLLAAALWGYVVGLAAAFLADLLVNFFFVPPLHRFSVQEPRHAVALGLFLAVATVGASMLALLRRQLRAAAASAAQATALLDLSTAIAHAPSARDGLHALCLRAVRTFGVRACAVLGHSAAGWRVADASGQLPVLTREEEAAAQAALDSAQVVFLRARPLRRDAAELAFVPFGRKTPEEGSLRLAGSITAAPGLDITPLLAAFADEASLALHRIRLTEQAASVEALRRTDEFRTTLVSSVSHNLRSPLTAIKAAVSSIRDPSLHFSPAAQSELLETVDSQVDRLSATVDGLLQITRLEGGAVRVQAEPVDVGALLAEAAAAFRRLHPERGLLIDASPNLWLRTDFALLLQALANLLENGARYSRSEGALTLSAHFEGGRVQIAVIDEGPPIAPSDLPHLFEKFYRGGAASGTSGSGLGLAIVKALAELCGGSVSVSSTLDGNRFAIDLAPAPAAVS